MCHTPSLGFATPRNSISTSCKYLYGRVHKQQERQFHIHIRSRGLWHWLGLTAGFSRVWWHVGLWRRRKDLGSRRPLRFLIPSTLSITTSTFRFWLGLSPETFVSASAFFSPFHASIIPRTSIRNESSSHTQNAARSPTLIQLFSARVTF
ncbi:hypothetical protein K439DRAFT_557754 [Ramaria rubella]|nr:hypothetical protein K439DRAFT_557754 [Ramaria rubella]